MNAVNEKYWYEQWHHDFELHSKLGIKNITKIEKSEPTSIYADTDSCDGNSLIKTQNSTIRIADWYKDNVHNGSAGTTIVGHESVLTNDKILNYSENGELFFTPVKRIIRHKVTKPKWKLKTKSGKEIIITNDHSMIVFRDGLKLEVKPSEILKTDKILVLKNNIY